MNIILMTELFWPSTGGGERQFYELAKHLAKEHEVHVYTLRLTGTPNEEVHKGIHIHRIGLLEHPTEGRSLWPLPFFFISLLFTKLPKNVDLIHCNSYIPPFAGYIRAKRHKSLFTGVVHDIYGDLWGRVLGSRFLAPLGKLIETVVCKLPYDALITVSNATKDSLVKSFDVPKERIHVCGSGIDVEFIDSIKSKGKKKNRIIYVGRLAPYKHVDDLIKAIGEIRKEIPNLECKIVGGGALKEKLIGLTNELNLDDMIEFTGRLEEYGEVISLIKSSEILALPSTQEGFGLVILEAMRCRTVPVVYDLPCFQDFCTNSNVRTLPKRDISGLAKAIKGLLKDRTKLKKMADEGFETSRNYSWNKFSERVEQVFAEVSKNQ